MARQPGGGRTGRQPDVLRLLKASEAPLSIAAIAERLGVHPNTARFHLDALVGSGRAEQLPPLHGRPGRPPQLFRAARGMDPAGPRHYRLLAEILVHSLAAGPDPGARAVAAGRAWGRRLAPVTDEAGEANEANDDGDARPGGPLGRLVSLLDELGFDPQLREADGRARVGLRHCPFLELAGPLGDVVCPVHLGLMQGAMDAWKAPVTVERLEAFAEPDLCLAHLATAGAGLPERIAGDTGRVTGIRGKDGSR
jgi:predicted ArsR family transcriptional regulator